MAPVRAAACRVRSCPVVRRWAAWAAFQRLQLSHRVYSQPAAARRKRRQARTLPPSRLLVPPLQKLGQEEQRRGQQRQNQANQQVPSGKTCPAEAGSSMAHKNTARHRGPEGQTDGRQLQPNAKWVFVSWRIPPARIQSDTHIIVRFRGLVNGRFFNFVDICRMADRPRLKSVLYYR